METTRISYDAQGSYNDGLHARARMVARELYQAGMWDGQQWLDIIDPMHQWERISLYGQPVTALKQGTDYRLH